LGFTLFIEYQHALIPKMSKLNLDSLLIPISDTAPSGEDAAYIPDFQQLEETATVGRNR